MSINPVTVSYIVPVYNAVSSIEGCVNSILKQTLQDLEVILIDDGSTDRSLDLCLEISKKDSRIIVFHKLNGGSSSARNLGLGLAKGRYIQFVDADDQLKFNMTEILIQELESKSIDLVMCGYEVKNFRTQISLDNLQYYSIGEVKDDFFRLCNSTYLKVPWNKLYKNELCYNISFDENMIIGEDLEFNLKYLGKCNSVSIISDTLYIYSSSGDNKLTCKYWENCFKNFDRYCQVINTFVSDERINKNINSFCSLFTNAYQHCVTTLIYSSGKSLQEIRSTIHQWEKEMKDISLINRCGHKNFMTKSHYIIWHFFRNYAISFFHSKLKINVSDGNK